MPSSRFEVGQKIKFRPSHNKALELEGTIDEISADGKSLLVTAEPDGKAVEVERQFFASAEDCRESEDAPAGRRKVPRSED